MGRHPKPTGLVLLEGNPGKRKRNKTEPRYEASGVPCVAPEWINEDGRMEYARLCGLLVDRAVLNDSNLTAFCQMCYYYGEWMQAVRAVNEQGAFVQTVDSAGRGVVTQVPEVKYRDQAFEAYKWLCVQFGLTPSSATRTQSDIPKSAGPTPTNVKAINARFPWK